MAQKLVYIIISIITEILLIVAAIDSNFMPVLILPILWLIMFLMGLREL